jgi:hypothetical protein
VVGAPQQSRAAPMYKHSLSSPSSPWTSVQVVQAGLCCSCAVPWGPRLAGSFL